MRCAYFDIRVGTRDFDFMHRQPNVDRNFRFHLHDKTETIIFVIKCQTYARSTTKSAVAVSLL